MNTIQIGTVKCENGYKGVENYKWTLRGETNFTNAT